MLGHLLTYALLLAAAEDSRRQAPVYSAEGVVNAATNRAGPIAPNTLVSIYGTGLCMGTRAISTEDLRGTILPTVLPGTGCRVHVGNIPANIYYASPRQINFLVPSSLLALAQNFEVVLNGLTGPMFKLTLAETAPGLFQLDPEFVVATRPDGSVVTPDSPAHPGEVVVFYATGLGRTAPPAVHSHIATTAARLVRSADFRVLLNGEQLDRWRVFYAGLTPGFGGLYQINVTLPDRLGDHPEVRVGVGEDLSPEGLKLPVTSSEPDGLAN